MRRRSTSKSRGEDDADSCRGFAVAAMCAVAFCGIASCSLWAAETDVSFVADVAPILERRCLECHNGDLHEGGLSLTTASDLRSGGDSGDALAASDAESSLLWLYVTGDNPEMPKSGRPLQTAEVETLRRWIDAGAAWPDDVKLQDKSLADLDWWSLRPLTRPPLPELTAREAARARTPIDHFVIAKLREHGWQLAPPADRRTVARRLFFDLTGLPPTPGEMQRFLEDPSPTAYDRLVDRLLASPRYGERWARHWLDVVKYADTCGYDKDKLREHAWPYRDYVVRSFNDDKSYTRFVHEQLAGDVLFPGSPDGILGLGFIAAGPWDFIGHVEVPEAKIDGKIARHIDRDEMVSNTLNTFASTTIQCARCHNHKFDPITQQHYYNLQSVFAAVDRAERTYDLDPQVELRRRDWTERRQAAERHLADLLRAISEAGGSELASIEQRIAELRPLATRAKKSPAFGYHSALATSADTLKWVQVDLGSRQPIDRIVLRPCHDDFAGIGAGFGFPVRYRIEVSDAPDFPPAATRVVIDRTADDQPNPGLAPVEFHLPDQRTGSSSTDDASKPPGAPQASARYVRLTATRLAERKHDYMLALAELQVLDNAGENIAQRAAVAALDSIEAPVRWSRANLTDGQWATAEDAAAATQLASAERQRHEILAAIETPQRLARREALQQEIEQAERELARLPGGRPVYAAATDFEPRGNFQPTRGRPRSVHVLHRGNVLDPRAAARPGAIPVFADEPSEFDLPDEHPEGARRAALALWLTRERHPLTWRSIVNRIWQHHFGQGLVATPNDFGRMGQPPTHPELLDWLAVEFRDGGQSMKQLHRMLVTSAVYRQASNHADLPAASGVASPATQDANNRLLWRFHRRRLSAEEVRDAILSVSGRFDLHMGGPGFYLFELEKADHSPHFEYHKFDPSDPASHRRSIYRFVVRSQPDPYMTTLDCADSSQSTPRRDETLTSLQALSLLNNKFNLTMASYFADRLRQERATLDTQIERAMQLIAARSPTPAERAALSAYGRQHGLENLCRVLLNLSEFIFVD